MRRNREREKWGEWVRKRWVKVEKRSKCSNMLTRGCIACSNRLWKSIFDTSKTNNRISLSLILAMCNIPHCGILKFALNPQRMGNTILGYIEWVEVGWRCCTVWKEQKDVEAEGNSHRKWINKHIMRACECVQTCTVCVHGTMCTFSTICTLPVQGFWPRTKKTATHAAQPTPTANESNHFYKMALVLFLVVCTLIWLPSEECN